MLRLFDLLVLLAIIVAVLGSATAVPLIEQVRCLCLRFLVFLIIFVLSLQDLQELEFVKRPFCNTFTGCGRKRMDLNELPFDEWRYWQPHGTGRNRLWLLVQSRLANGDGRAGSTANEMRSK